MSDSMTPVIERLMHIRICDSPFIAEGKPRILLRFAKTNLERNHVVCLLSYSVVKEPTFVERAVILPDPSAPCQAECSRTFTRPSALRLTRTRLSRGRLGKERYNQNRGANYLMLAAPRCQLRAPGTSPTTPRGCLFHPPASRDLHKPLCTLTLGDDLRCQRADFPCRDA